MENGIENLHQKINLRGMLEAFLDIAIESFQESLDKKKVLGNDILYNSFKKALFYTGGNISKAQLTFLAYGRMVDMGVGKGVTWSTQKYARSYWAKRTKDRPARKRKPWYSKTKSHQVIRLREILAEQYGIGLLAEVENAISQSVILNHLF